MATDDLTPISQADRMGVADTLEKMADAKEEAAARSEGHANELLLAQYRSLNLRAAVVHRRDAAQIRRAAQWIRGA